MILPKKFVRESREKWGGVIIAYLQVALLWYPGWPAEQAEAWTPGGRVISDRFGPQPPAAARHLSNVIHPSFLSVFSVLFIKTS